MKNLRIILFIVVSAFISFGFVLISKEKQSSPQIEELHAMDQGDGLQTVQDTNEDMW